MRAGVNRVFSLVSWAWLVKQWNRFKYRGDVSALMGSKVGRCDIPTQVIPQLKSN